MTSLITGSTNEGGDSACPLFAFDEKDSFTEDELISIIKVFSLLKKQRDKIRNNNLDTQVDTFELK